MKFNIYLNEKLLDEDLTENEYFDRMQSLAEDFYQSGSPNPENLKTEIVSD
jgi:hypothetical protein